MCRTGGLPTGIRRKVRKMRYFLIDRITEFSPGRSAAAVKNVTLAEEILHDHFPGYPVFPGALIIEAMAQLGGFLLEMSFNQPGLIRRAILVQVDRFKFHRLVEPGEQLYLRAEIGPRLDDAAKINGLAEVAGEKAARGTLTFALRDLEEELIHDQRRLCYRLWTRHLPGLPEIL